MAARSPPAAWPRAWTCRPRVAPFILRGVSLLGIDSVMAPKALRLEAWRRIASDLDHAKLAALSTTVGFDDIVGAAHDIVDGKIRGRVVVDM